MNSIVKWICLILVLVGLSGCTSSRPSLPAQPRPSVPRSAAPAAPDQLMASVVEIAIGRTRGTGVHVATGSGYALYTAEHVVRDAANSRDWAQVLFRPLSGADSEWQPISRFAHRAHWNRQGDYAVFELRAPLPAVRPAQIAPDDPRPGQRVSLVGVGNRQQPVRHGTLLARCSGVGTLFFASSVAARGGDSGGPLFDERGRVVALLTSGAAQEMTSECSCHKTSTTSQCSWSPGPGPALGARALAVRLPRQQ
jgi:hypothetical protein